MQFQGNSRRLRLAFTNLLSLSCSVTDEPVDDSGPLQKVIQKVFFKRRQHAINLGCLLCRRKMVSLRLDNRLIGFQNLCKMFQLTKLWANGIII